MKKIVIQQENSESLILFDNDQSNLTEYTKKISELLKSTKVCILETTCGVVTLKPSKTNSIFITEIENKELDEKINLIEEDIIKD